MSYYRPSYSQIVAMSRVGRGYPSSRGSYRGSSTRGSSSWGSSRGNYVSPRGSGSSRFSFPQHSSFDSRSKYSSSSDKYSSSRSHVDDYRKPYRSESNAYSSSRDHRTPDRKRPRLESSHDRSFAGSGDYSNSRYESDRRSFSSDRRPPPITRKEEFRKPPPPPSSPRGGYRGRISSRGSLRARFRERPTRRRLVESSYSIRKRAISGRYSDARRLKISRMRSGITKSSSSSSKKEEKEPSVQDDEKKSEKIEEKVEKEEIEKEKEKEKVSPKKSPKKEEVVSSDKEDAKDSDDEEKSKASFIKLTCPHCLTRCATFGKYTLHLQSGRHASAMRRVAIKQKTLLSQMRLLQRQAQRELEKNAEDLAPRTNWCPLCKLNYKQPKLTHQASQAHKDMKKFLMPYCKICKVTFKSPMIFESHTCSIEHIKRKALANGEKSEKEDGSGNEEDAMENFMTIDSVGDIDEDGESSDKKDGETKPKEQINVGLEYIRKVEVHYCDLCRMYLPRVSDEEELNKTLARHCKQRTHLQKYIRYKEDKELAKKAERLQRKETAEKEKEKEENKESELQAVKEEEAPKAELNNSVDEEKLWEDVDKDLGEILADATNKSSDEDEDDSMINGERYDRFKYSEKNIEDDANKDEKDVEVKTEVSESEK